MLSEMSACEDRRAVGRETWNLCLLVNGCVQNSIGCTGWPSEKLGGRRIADEGVEQAVKPENVLACCQSQSVKPCWSV